MLALRFSLGEARRIALAAWLGLDAIGVEARGGPARALTVALRH